MPATTVVIKAMMIMAKSSAAPRCVWLDVTFEMMARDLLVMIPSGPS
jgi:hypothetical protein